MYSQKLFSRIRAGKLACPCGQRTQSCVHKRPLSTSISNGAEPTIFTSISTPPHQESQPTRPEATTAAHNQLSETSENVFSKPIAASKDTRYPQEAQYDREAPAHGGAPSKSNSDGAGSIVKIDGRPRTKDPYVRRELPSSPWMESKYPAKHAFKTRGPRKSERTALQEQLERNPFAQALASPVRMCSVTRTWLPNFFLQDFELIANPETGAPWYMPRSLTSSVPQDQIRETSPNPERATAVQSVARRPTTIGPKGYVLSRHALLESSGGKGGLGQFWRLWLDKKHMLNRASHLKNVNFRNDMHELVLRLMRKRIVEELLWLANKGVTAAAYLSPCKEETLDEVYQGLHKKKQIATVLWIDREQIPGADVRARNSDGANHSPGDFATFKRERALRSYTPIYNLQRLLGEESVTRLRQEAPRKFADAAAVTVKHRLTTVSLQARLWKLQGYMSTYDD